MNFFHLVVVVAALYFQDATASQIKYVDSEDSHLHSLMILHLIKITFRKRTLSKWALLSTV